jgi:hypothetical protein
MPEAQDLRRALSTAPRRCRTSGPHHHTRWRWHGSGRALRGVSRIQRGRPAPAHRHFGSATSRTRTTDATTVEDRQEDPVEEGTPDHGLTTKGSRKDAVPCPLPSVPKPLPVPEGGCCPSPFRPRNPQMSGLAAAHLSHLSVGRRSRSRCTERRSTSAVNCAAVEAGDVKRGPGPCDGAHDPGPRPQGGVDRHVRVLARDRKITPAEYRHATGET